MQTVSDRTFAPKLIERTRTDRPTLIHAMMELTYGCNLRCVHCYNATHEAKGELKTLQVFKILKELCEEGCLWIGFTGGEVLMRQDLFEIIRYAKELGMIPSILTNATRITPDVAKRVRDLGVNQVEISIYGASKETYERVTQIPGSFSRFVEGVDFLAAEKVPMVLKVILLTLNAHEFELMLEFAMARRLHCKVSTDIFPRVDGSMAPLDYRLPPQEILRIQQLILERTGRTMPLSDCSQEDKNRGDLFDCACGKSGAAITPHGKMNLCISIHDPLYDVLNRSVKEGWNHLVEYVAEVRPGPSYECFSCSLKNLCSRGAKHSWLTTKTYDRDCIPYYRELAEEARHWKSYQQ